MWLTIAVDASPWGIGGVLMKNGSPHRWFADEIHDIDLQILKDKNGHSAARGDHRFQTTWEALALLVAIRAWRTEEHSGAMVVIQSDSLSALSAIAKQGSTSSSVSRVLHELALDDADMDSGLTQLTHIPGLANVWPDALSRLWEPVHAKKFPIELSKVERTHVPERSVDAFWTSLRAFGKQPAIRPAKHNRRVVIQMPV
jgi:hypothetical protein